VLVEIVSIGYWLFFVGVVGFAITSLARLIYAHIYWRKERNKLNIELASLKKEIVQSQLEAFDRAYPNGYSIDRPSDSFDTIVTCIGCGQTTTFTGSYLSGLYEHIRCVCWKQSNLFENLYE
jgi:hypothetical protein